MNEINQNKEAPKREELLEVKNISCRYKREVAVANVSIKVEKGKQVCLLGPSGCGKTTILRAIAGFHYPSSGSISIGGQEVFGANANIRPENRRVGMVFQDNALFPNMTVLENVQSGLRRMHLNNRRKNAMELLERMDIEDHALRYPHELSSGQQQRVALARALAPKPLLLLMDEPFSNLDLELRERMGQDISDILKINNITCVMVTHDQHDAFALGDEVGLMSAGSIMQWDSPYNLYHQPASRFVADFIGNGVFVPGRIASNRIVKTELGSLTRSQEFQLSTGTEVDVLLRPDDVVQGSDKDIEAVVLRRAFKGAEILYTLSVSQNLVLLALFPSHTNFSVGEKVRVRLEVNHVVAFQRVVV